jgi:hypothetical protein
MDAELQRIIERYGGLAIILILLAAGWFAIASAPRTEADEAERACAEHARTHQACAVAGAMTGAWRYN